MENGSSERSPIKIPFPIDYIYLINLTFNMSSINLFIFGAGASKADHIPLQNELISEILNLLETSKDIHKYPSINSLKNFLRKMYPIAKESQSSILYPTFEEILGLLQFALDRDESFKGFSQEQLGEFIKLISALMAVVIEEKAIISNKVNEKFITELFESFKRQQQDLKSDKIMEKFAKENFFLNINYDTLLDKALDNLTYQYGGINSIDFCLEIKDSNIPSKDIKLFKPHGTLNLLICKSCGIKTIGGPLNIGFEYFKSLIIPGFGLNNCPHCKVKKYAIIIPPTFFKELNNVLIRNVLINLEEHLKEVQNLIFIGYSFPEADLHLKYVFKKAQLFGGFKKIILIDRYDEKKLQKDCPYFYNIKRSFPGVELVDLTYEIPLPNGLAENSIEEIIDHLSKHIYGS